MDLKICEICSPHKRRDRIEDDVVDIRTAAASRNWVRPHPIGRKGGRIYFIEVLSSDAVRITLQRDRPSFEVRKDEPRGADVVIDDLGFREAAWVENFVEVWNRNLPAVDRERLAPLPRLGHEHAYSNNTYVFTMPAWPAAPPLMESAAEFRALLR